MRHVQCWTGALSAVNMAHVQRILFKILFKSCLKCWTGCSVGVLYPTMILLWKFIPRQVNTSYLGLSLYLFQAMEVAHHWNSSKQFFFLRNLGTNGWATSGQLMFLYSQIGTHKYFSRTEFSLRANWILGYEANFMHVSMQVCKYIMNPKLTLKVETTPTIIITSLYTSGTKLYLISPCREWKA